MRPFPHTRTKFIGKVEHKILRLSAEECWRVRDVVEQRGGWEPAPVFGGGFRPRRRVFTRCDLEGKLLRPLERRWTHVGKSSAEHSRDLPVLLEQLARAEPWAP